MSTPSIRLGIIHDLPDEQYHGHAKSIGSTGLKQLLVSPAKFRHELANPRTSNALEEGAVAHRIVLGKGAEYEVLEFDDRRTNAYKEKAEEARAAGVIPILTKEYEKAKRIADAVLNHPVAGPLVGHGEAEVSAFATDPATSVWRRARADRLHDDGLIVDLKTSATSVQPAWWAVGRTAKNLGYQISAAHYIDTFELAERSIRGFVHVFVEKEPPHLVSVIELDELAIEDGRTKVAKALEVFRDCTESGIWPDWTDYPDPITRVSLPGVTSLKEN